MLSFTIAHIAIIALRLKDPTRDRPYRAPWNINVRGKPVPMTAVLGALGTGAAFASVVALHPEARTVGVGWMVAGTTGYFIYRRRQGLEIARMQAKVAGCWVRCRLIRTRNSGRAIVEAAKERDSDLIYISTEHAPSEEKLLGPTIRYVLAHRPSRVVVEHDPDAVAPWQNGHRPVEGPPTIARTPEHAAA